MWSFGDGGGAAAGRTLPTRHGRSQHQISDMRSHCSPGDSGGPAAERVQPAAYLAASPGRMSGPFTSRFRLVKSLPCDCNESASVHQVRIRQKAGGCPDGMDICNSELRGWKAFCSPGDSGRAAAERVQLNFRSEGTVGFYMM